MRKIIGWIITVIISFGLAFFIVSALDVQFPFDVYRFRCPPGWLCSTTGGDIIYWKFIVDVIVWMIIFLVPSAIVLHFVLRNRSEPIKK